MKKNESDFSKELLDSCQRLLQLGEKIFALRKSINFNEGDIVAFKALDDAEPWFMFADVSPRKTPVLRYLKGWQELGKFFDYTKTGAPPVPGWMLELNMLELHLATANAVFPGEARLLKTLGKPLRKNGPARPIARSIKSGMAPWLPDDSERNILERLLYQTLGVFLRLEDDEELLTRHLPYGILYRRQEKNNMWVDEVLEQQSLKNSGFPIFIPEEARKEFAGLAMTDEELAMDFRFLPLTIEGVGQRQPLQYVLIAVNDRKKSIASCTPLSGEKGIPELWNTLPKIILGMFKDMGGCPAVIHTCSRRFHAFMRAFSMERPFKMVFHEHLETINQATAMLTHNFENRNGQQIFANQKPNPYGEKKND